MLVTGGGAGAGAKIAEIYVSILTVMTATHLGL